MEEYDVSMQHVTKNNPKILSFTAESYFLRPGQGVELAWETSGGDHIELCYPRNGALYKRTSEHSLEGISISLNTPSLMLFAPSTETRYTLVLSERAYPEVCVRVIKEKRDDPKERRKEEKRRVDRRDVGGVWDER